MIWATCVFLLLVIVLILWNDPDPGNSATLDAFYDPPSKQRQHQQRRLWEDITAEGPDINDDITRDETCKQYMSKFLNGTTDFKDECVGMVSPTS